ncbi:MAG: DUF4097 family beta strand repeat-containing protein [Isosphaeraceae bacterium]
MRRNPSTEFTLRDLAWAAPVILIVSFSCVLSLARVTLAEKREFKVSERPSLSITTFNGSITVRAGSGGQIKTTVQKVGMGATQEDAEADLLLTEVEYKQEADAVQIVARRRGNSRPGSAGANFEVEVPEGTSLTLQSSNGSFAIEGVRGTISARTTNGEIQVRDGAGKLDLNSSNGGIEAQASETVVTAETSNGDVVFSGTLAAGSHSLTTSNGSIHCKLPADASFRFEASTSNGKVTSGYSGLKPTAGKTGTHQLAGQVGAPGETPTELKLSTRNGSIRLDPAGP